jgi:hypothetical protein
MVGIRCVAIYRFLGAEEMDFGLSEISNVEIRLEPIGVASELLGAVLYECVYERVCMSVCVWVCV